MLRCLNRLLSDHSSCDRDVTCMHIISLAKSYPLMMVNSGMISMSVSSSVTSSSAVKDKTGTTLSTITDGTTGTTPASMPVVGVKALHHLQGRKGNCN